MARGVPKPRAGRLIRACKNGTVFRLAAEYIAENRGDGQLLNIAGFCRSLGVSVGEFEGLRMTHPDIHGILCAAFEDEALNSEIPASVLTLYLRDRLDYDRPGDAKDAPVTVVFEHDLLKDGS